MASGGSGGSSSSEDSAKSSSKLRRTSSSSGGSRSFAIDEVRSGLPCGMETKEWGGIDLQTESRCHHGKQPRRLLCWNGKNTGCRYLACPLMGKTRMCDFIEWKDDKWTAMF